MFLPSNYTDRASCDISWLKHIPGGRLTQTIFHVITGDLVFLLTET